MKSVIQRVSSASVSVNGETVGKINQGILVFLGISDDDTYEDIKWLADKIIALRIFEDENKKMNLSLNDISGELLIVSQFTLFGKCKKGRRPDFTLAGKPQFANKMYEDFVNYLKPFVKKVQTGIFGADMLISAQNDGPVTLIIDSKE